MEFNFIVRKDFSVDNEGFLVIEGNKLTSSLVPSNLSSNLNKKFMDSPITEKTAKLAEILNRMGEASAKVYNILIFYYNKSKNFFKKREKEKKKFFYVGSRSSDYYHLLR